MRRSAGFTVLELLITIVIMAIVFATVAALLANSRQAYATNEEVTSRQQEIQLAINLFRYEVGLAGYRGACSGADSLTFSDPTFEVQRGTNSDSITVRYYEDRWPDVSCGVLRTMELYVDESEDMLYTIQDGGAAQPAMPNIHSVNVVEYLDTNGGRTSQMPAAGFIGVSIRVTYDNPREDFTQFVVGIKNPQHDPTDN